MPDSINVVVNSYQVTQMLTRLRGRVNNPRPIMAEIGEIVVESVQRNFEEHQSPDGARWAALSDKYAAWKVGVKGRNADDILILNRILMGSIHKTASAHEVRIGTNIDYAATHQLGDATRNIPARPFLGIRDDDWPEIEAAIQRHLFAVGL